MHKYPTRGEREMSVPTHSSASIPVPTSVFLFFRFSGLELMCTVRISRGGLLQQYIMYAGPDFDPHFSNPSLVWSALLVGCSFLNCPLFWRTDLDFYKWCFQISCSLVQQINVEDVLYITFQKLYHLLLIFNTHMFTFRARI